MSTRDVTDSESGSESDTFWKEIRRILKIRLWWIQNFWFVPTLQLLPKCCQNKSLPLWMLLMLQQK